MLVRAAWAAVVHLALRARREALERAVRALRDRVATVCVPRRRARKVARRELRLHRRLIEVDTVVLHHAGAGDVPSNGLERARRRRCIERRAVAAHETAHLRARDPQARVRLLKGVLDRRKVGVSARVIQAELHVPADRRRRRRVAVVHERQHRRREHRTLRRVLLRAVRLHHADLEAARERQRKRTSISSRALTHAHAWARHSRMGASRVPR